MTIRFLCPRGHKLAVPDNLAGKKGRCPICQQRVYIPVPELADTTDVAPAADVSSGLSERPGRGITGTTGEPMADAHRSPEWPTHAVPPLVPPLGPLPDVAATLPPPVAQPRAVTSLETATAPTDGHFGPPPVPNSDFRVPHSDVPPPPPEDLRSAQNDGPQELAVIIDEAEEPEGYQADPGKVQTTYMLALALGALTLLCAAPALRHPNLIEAPNWARVVLVASALQLIFICWMVSLPDWSTVWICMVVFAFVAALYGVAWAVITFTPDYMPVNFLDLDEPPDNPVRTRAGPWCFVMLMLATLLTYACGRFSGRWRKQYEMAKALRE